MTAHTLPTTRFLRQRRGRRSWLVIALGSLAINGGLVAGLLALGRWTPPTAPPVIATTTLRRVPPPPTSAPVVPPTRVAAPATPAAFTLPPLQGAPGIISDAFALPALGNGRISDLPLAVAATSDLIADGSGSLLSGQPPALVIDEPAQLIESVDLMRAYPRDARARGIEGSSYLRLDISDRGIVTACQVLDSQPPGVFDAAADTLGRRLRFRAARHDGAAVASQQTLVLQWQMQR